MSQDKALLKFGEKELELPVMEGSEKELGIDISKLRASTGLVTVDNGFVNSIVYFGHNFPERRKRYS